jgi:cell division protein FtsL
VLHLPFWGFGLLVVAVLAVGLVCLNALRVDAAYEAHVLRERVGLMLEERGTLVRDVARLSSPSRVGDWATGHGLVHPEPGAIVILQVPGDGDGPAG